MEIIFEKFICYPKKAEGMLPFIKEIETKIVQFNILKPYKILGKMAGSRESAERIRKYVKEFILQSDVMKVDYKDHLIKNTYHN